MKKITLILSLILAITATVKADPGTTFTYQGRLADGSTPIETAVDLRFSLVDAATSGTQVGSSIEVQNTAYDGGIVQIDLDFGSGAFAGDPRWLQIELANPTGDTYTTLTPLIEVLPTPYSIYAETAGSVIGGVDDADADATNELNTNLQLNGRSLELTDAGGTLSVDLTPIDAASRIPIDTLPFTISSSGSYYLADSITTAGGITINASYVTLDLNGNSLTNTVGDGITAGAFTGIHITNGIVAGCGSDGIDVSAATLVQLDHLTIRSNADNGITAGDEATIENCYLTSQLDHAILVANNCIVRNNNIHRNGNSNSVDSAINVTGNNNIIRDNRAVLNSRGVVVSGTDNYLKDNVIYRTTGFTDTGSDRYTSSHVINSDGNQLDLLIAQTPFGMVHGGKATLIGNVTAERDNEPGLFIGSSNVTIDLNGYELIGLGRGGITTTYFSDPSISDLGLDDPPNTSGLTDGDAAGILIEQTYGDIMIKNGTIRNWGDQAIRGRINPHILYFSMLKDLIITGNDNAGINVEGYNILQNISVRLNDGDGITLGSYNLAADIIAEYNDDDGIAAGSNNILSQVNVNYNLRNGIDAINTNLLTNSVALNNLENGFEVGNAALVANSSANENSDDGFETGTGDTALVVDSTAQDNGILGFEFFGEGALVIGSTARVNNLGGFELVEGSLVFNSTADFNGNDSENTTSSDGEDFGFSLAGDSLIRQSSAYDNGSNNATYLQTGDGAGIWSDGADTRIDQNTVTDSSTGIETSSPGIFTTRNRVNNSNFPNYNLNGTGSWGPIVDVSTVGSITSRSNNSHPQANFEF